MTDLTIDEPDLYAFLTAQPTVSALIADRVYQERIPQPVRGGDPVFPCACYFRASAIRTETFASQDNIVEGNFQLDVYAVDPATKLAIGRAIRRTLLPYSGPMGGCKVDRILLQTDFDQAPELEPGLYRRTYLYQIWYWED